MSNIVFSNVEINMLTDFLEVYRLSEAFVIRKELALSLIESSLSKLANLSVLTFFTKQEYTIMYAALDYIISHQDELGIVVYGKVYRLLDKVGKLAE